ncbi:NAD(P)-dependent dehydrogenase (short-subunit alcohol dehydrogenase family) [Rhizobium skierniewicense]|uniref:NAD(P)-dependent dehydrogenase (Short-subunit alcohol dehydrogenase family) n=1 Tax=Rhizobium skierniewicense TaxID=984260 RepID=A0A7W6G291_9HYPH|nr:SDR family oxidoreductase [Rhizobium skierniewicense]MBB3945306.1 NAD(P)-dependent dehydrogenase (short-subunit alcohol dehydrogenase family) [Rhizobium skierniewicense]
MPTVKGLRVLVTAGASGIGLEIARAFVASGAAVFVCDSSAEAVEALAVVLPSAGSAVCDVTDRTAVDTMFTAAIGALGGLDTLVNNAGISGPTGRVDEIMPEDWDRTLAVNLTGQYNLVRLAVAELRKSDCASILCMSSAAGRMAYPNRSPYAAAKWAVIGFMKTIAAELGSYDIRANAILPGMVDGPRLQAVVSAKAAVAQVHPADIIRKGLAGTSIKRLVSAEEVAALAVFLASREGGAISGQAIGIDNDLHYMA